MVSGFSQKYTKSFGGKKSCTVQWICPIKIQSICLFSDRTLYKNAEFFSFLATLPSQKIVKEIAYIPTSFQAPYKSAKFFLLIH